MMKLVFVVAATVLMAISQEADGNSHGGCPLNDKDFESMTIAGKENCINFGRKSLKRIQHERTRKKRAAYYKYIWPKADDGFVYIPYTYGNSLNDKSKNAFEEAVKRFNAETCIRLIPMRSSDDDHIALISDPEYGCSSLIGRGGGKQLLSLDEGCGIPGIAQHEVMHALGIDHTMVRGDRDRYIDINWSNIMTGFASQFRAFIPLSEIDIYGEDYCYDSIMMYGKSDFAVDKSIPVITVKDPNYKGEIGQRETWAPCDLRQINRIYKCYDYLDIKGLPDKKPTKK